MVLAHEFLLALSSGVHFEVSSDHRQKTVFLLYRSFFKEKKWKESYLFPELKASVQLATCLSPTSYTKDGSDFFIDINFFRVQLLRAICDTYVEKLLLQ